MEENNLICRIVVIGGSAGSLDVVLKIIAALPVTSHTVFLIVLHRKYDYESLLTELVSHRTLMPIKEVEDKEPIRPDTVYLAPADYHLLLESRAFFSLDASEKIHFSRPSINVTFESVAEAFGPHAIGVLLSGANEDGAGGLLHIKQRGGMALVQDPETAEVGIMPAHAIKRKAVTHVLPAEALPAFIASQLVHNR